MTDEKKVIIEFEGPDEWTQGHWITYAKARDGYYEKMRKAEMYTDSITAAFVAAKAMIDQGIVRIRNADALVKIVHEANLDSPEIVKLNVLNLVGDGVAALVNAAMKDPLDRYLNAPPPTSPLADSESRLTQPRTHPKS